MAKHARLSASSSDRWLNCPPSLLLNEARAKEPVSEFALEGTLAHAIAEVKARIALEGHKDTGQLDEYKKHDLYAKEMEGYTDSYVEYLEGISYGMSKEPYMLIEQQLDYGAYAEGGFGTADFIAIGDGHLHIVDFKYGKGVEVEAKKNSQLMLYALGAWSMYKAIFKMEKFTVHVYQPRIGNISSYPFNLLELLDFADEVQYKSRLALRGEGRFKVGDHCRFCRVRATCRARAEANIRLAGFTSSKPEELSHDEIVDCIKQGENIQAWLNDLKAYALDELMGGKNIKGLKAVEGRSRRVITDPAGLAEALRIEGLKDEEIFKPKELMNITTLEKKLGQKEFAEISKDFVEKPKGKPTLALEDDKRQAINLGGIFNDN